MIKGNWSLSNDLRNEQRKQQLKIQQKQKHQLKLQKLTNADPIRLYKQIQRLKSQGELNERDAKYLSGLEEDWLFIEKNGLHKEVLKNFLEEIETKQKAKELEQSKQYGSKSIYFNPELNPLGKVPKNIINPQKPFNNYTIPLKHQNKYNYPKDPEIDVLNIILPQGDPPKFYKLVQNVTDNVILLNNEPAPTQQFIPNVLKRRKEKKVMKIDDDGYDNDNEYAEESNLAPEEEEFYQSKKTKI